MKPTFIPFARPDYTEAEAQAVADAVRGGWTTSGPRVAEFESKFASYVGAKHALAVSSCTAGLHLALSALGVGPGDEVITTPLTFCATVNAILQTGATPVLVDVGEDLNVCPQEIKTALTRRTKAILPVHIGGLPCDMDAIWDLARRHRLYVVEDAAHAAGAGVSSNRIGAGPSDAVAFSFYATKNLSTGEGGMVTTGDQELAERMRILALHGISRDAWKRRNDQDSWFYEVVAEGYKYNLSDILAALGIVQLSRLEKMNRRRREIAARYTEIFSGIPGIEPAPEIAGRTHAWQLYILRLRPEILGVSRSEFIRAMRAQGVECSVHFIPIPLHPYYADKLEFRHPLTRALTEYERIVSLPLYSGLTDAEVEQVIAAVQETASVHAG